MTISNPDIVTVLRQRIDQCRCLGAVPATRCCGGCEHDSRCLTEIVCLRADLCEAQRERDEARRVLKSIVEEFVQHAQAMNPFYPATPMHECEFSWNPESGKCDACEAWGDYVLICHPLEETGEETP